MMAEGKRRESEGEKEKSVQVHATGRAWSGGRRRRSVPFRTPLPRARTHAHTTHAHTHTHTRTRTHARTRARSMTIRIESTHMREFTRFISQNIHACCKRRFCLRHFISAREFCLHWTAKPMALYAAIRAFCVKYARSINQCSQPSGHCTIQRWRKDARQESLAHRRCQSRRFSRKITRLHLHARLSSRVTYRPPHFSGFGQLSIAEPS